MRPLVTSLNGSDQYLEYSADGWHEEWLGQSKSVGLQVKVNDNFADSFIPLIGNLSALDGSTPDNYWSLVIYNDLTFAIRYKGAGEAIHEVRSTTPLALSTWTHIAVSKEVELDESFTVTLYLNGQVDASDHFDIDGSTANANPVRIGIGLGLNFSGGVCDVYFWNRVVDSEEWTWRYPSKFTPHKAEIDEDGLPSHFSLFDPAASETIFPNSVTDELQGAYSSFLNLVSLQAPNGTNFELGPEFEDLYPDYEVGIRPGWQVAPVLNGEDQYIELNETLPIAQESGSVTVQLGLEIKLRDEILPGVDETGSIVTGQWSENFDTYPLDSGDIASGLWTKSKFVRTKEVGQIGASCFEYFWDTLECRRLEQLDQNDEVVNTFPWRRAVNLGTEITLEFRIRATLNGFADPRATNLFHVLTNMDTNIDPLRNFTNTFLTADIDLRCGVIQIILQDINAGGNIRASYDWQSNVLVDDDLWHDVAVFLKLNTWEGNSYNSDGEIQVWIDGESQFTFSDIAINRHSPLARWSQVILDPNAYAYPIDADEFAAADFPRSLYIDELTATSGKDVINLMVPRYEWITVYRWLEDLDIENWIPTRAELSVENGTDLRITQTSAKGNARPSSDVLNIRVGDRYRVRSVLSEVSAGEDHDIRIGSSTDSKKYLESGDFNTWHQFAPEEEMIRIFNRIETNSVGDYIQLEDFTVQKLTLVPATPEIPPARDEDSLPWTAQGAAGNGGYDSPTRSNTADGDSFAFSDVYVEVATEAGKSYRVNVSYLFNLNTQACSMITISDNNAGTLTTIYNSGDIECSTAAAEEANYVGYVEDTIVFEATGTTTRIAGRIYGWPASTVETATLALGHELGDSLTGDDLEEAEAGFIFAGVNEVFSINDATYNTRVRTSTPTISYIHSDNVPTANANGGTYTHRIYNATDVIIIYTYSDIGGWSNYSYYSEYARPHPRAIGTWEHYGLTGGNSNLSYSNRWYNDPDSENVPECLRGAFEVDAGTHNDFRIDLPHSDATWELTLAAGECTYVWTRTSNQISIIDGEGTVLKEITGGTTANTFRDINNNLWHYSDWDANHTTFTTKIAGDHVIVRIGPNSSEEAILNYFHLKRVG